MITSIYNSHSLLPKFFENNLFGNYNITLNIYFTFLFRLMVLIRLLSGIMGVCIIHILVY